MEQELSDQNKVYTLQAHDIHGYDVYQLENGLIASEDFLEELEEFDSIVINQETQFQEGCLRCLGCCCLDFTNRYDLYYGNSKVNHRPYDLLVEEVDSNCLWRALCNPAHELVLKVTASRHGQGHTVLQIVKPYRCCCPAVLPCCQKEATVYRNRGKDLLEVGYIQQPLFAGCLRPSLDIYDKKEGARVGSVTGPICCIGGQFCSTHWVRICLYYTHFSCMLFSFISLI